MNKGKISAFFKEKLSEIKFYFKIPWDLWMEFPYTISTAFVFICTLVQIVVAKSGILFHITIFIFFVLCLMILALFKLPKYKEKKRVMCTGLVFGVLSLFVCSEPFVIWGDDCYHFKNGEEITQIVTFNVKFNGVYRHAQHLPKKLDFTIITNIGGYQLSHLCTAYVDIATWKKFDLDERKLRSFVRADITKRLTSSLDACRLQESMNYEKVHYYENGVCKTAKFQPIVSIYQ